MWRGMDRERRENRMFHNLGKLRMEQLQIGQRKHQRRNRNPQATIRRRPGDSGQPETRSAPDATWVSRCIQNYSLSRIGRERAAFVRRSQREG